MAKKKKNAVFRIISTPPISHPKQNIIAPPAPQRSEENKNTHRAVPLTPSSQIVSNEIMRNEKKHIEKIYRTGKSKWKKTTKKHSIKSMAIPSYTPSMEDKIDTQSALEKKINTDWIHEKENKYCLALAHAFCYELNKKNIRADPHTMVEMIRINLVIHKSGKLIHASLIDHHQDRLSQIILNEAYSVSYPPVPHLLLNNHDRFVIDFTFQASAMAHPNTQQGTKVPITFFVTSFPSL